MILVTQRPILGRWSHRIRLRRWKGLFALVQRVSVSRGTRRDNVNDGLWQAAEGWGRWGGAPLQWGEHCVELAFSCALFINVYCCRAQHGNTHCRSEKVTLGSKSRAARLREALYRSIRRLTAKKLFQPGFKTLKSGATESFWMKSTQRIDSVNQFVWWLHHSQIICANTSVYCINN